MSVSRSNIQLRNARRGEARELAELALASGENLLTTAFGGNRNSTLLALEALSRTTGTMFSFDRATVAVEPGCESPVGLIVAHPSGSDRAHGKRLAEVLVRERGWFQWLRMLPTAFALEHCSEPIPLDTAYVSILAVNASHRCAGIGSALIECAETVAMHNGEKMVCLDVELSNPGAIRFYERHGYETVSEHVAGVSLQRRGVTGLRRLMKRL